MEWRRAIGSIGVLLILTIGSRLGAARSTGAPETVVYNVDIAHPTIQYKIELSSAALKQARFVEVVVAQVFNPKRYGLTFDVVFEARGSAAVRLGAFSLYPPDNPGTFIVPTHGKVGPEGSIVVSMVVTD